MTWQFSLAGLLVGVLVGMTGMGGGSLMTPILILLFGFDAKVAVGTDILHGAVFKSFGAARHRMLGTVHARLACWMLVGSAPLSLVGVEVANTVGDNSMSNFQKIVGGALILGGAGFLARTFIKARAATFAVPSLDARQGDRDRDRRRSAGFVVGLTSVGSGTFFGLAMLFAYPLTASKMVGTDMFHAAVLLWVAGISHLLHGDVDKHAIALAPHRVDPRRAARLAPLDPRPRAGRCGSASGSCCCSRGSSSSNVPEANWRDRDHARGDVGRARPRRVPRPEYRGAARLRRSRGPAGGVESPGRGPGALDRVLRRSPGCDCGRVRPHRGCEDRAQPDLRDEDHPEDLLADLQPPLLPLPGGNIVFRLRKKQHIEVWIGSGTASRVATIVAGKTFPKGEVHARSSTGPPPTA